eukprot:6229070-Amphidinium_carterae.1
MSSPQAIRVIDHPYLLCARGWVLSRVIVRYSLGRGRPDMPRDDLGQHDVPTGVEKALIGMRVGGQRSVEMPRRLKHKTASLH